MTTYFFVAVDRSDVSAALVQDLAQFKAMACGVDQGRPAIPAGAADAVRAVVMVRWRDQPVHSAHACGRSWWWRRRRRRGVGVVKVNSPILGFNMGAMRDSPPHDGLLRAAAHVALLFDDCVLLVKWRGGCPVVRLCGCGRLGHGVVSHGVD